MTQDGVGTVRQRGYQVAVRCQLINPNTGLEELIWLNTDPWTGETTPFDELPGEYKLIAEPPENGCRERVLKMP